MGFSFRGSKRRSRTAGFAIAYLDKKNSNQMVPVLPLLDDQITMVASNVFLLDWSERGTHSTIMDLLAHRPEIVVHCIT